MNHLLTAREPSASQGSWPRLSDAGPPAVPSLDRGATVERVELAVPAVDGFKLGATLFVPAHGNGRLVLVSPATAVQRRLYARLAAFLAGRGCAVLTWDWRGTGSSRPASLRGFAGTMRTWAEYDLEGVIAWASQVFPGHRLTAVGHSFGGQAFGLVPSATRLAAFVTIAAQNGYVGHWPGLSRAGLRVLWHALMPGVARAIGFWPGRTLGTGEDLPRGVALEWAKWCRSRAYHGEFARYARLHAPMLAYSIDDDWIAPVAAVDALHRSYSGCPVTRRHLVPAELGVPRIGHFGLFRQAATAGVWEEIHRWLTDPHLPHRLPSPCVAQL